MSNSSMHISAVVNVDQLLGERSWEQLEEIIRVAKIYQEAIAWFDLTDKEKNSRPIDAIVSVRERTGMSLTAARHRVDFWRRGF